MMATETSEWAAALGQLPSGLFIVTVREGEAETGMLASWVQQCSFDPPRVSIAVKPGRLAGDWLRPGKAFVVNVIGEGQTHLVKHFGKGFAPGEPAFEGLNVDASKSAPVLTYALAYLEVEAAERVSAGDHDLVIATVVGGTVLRDGKPTVHVRKSGMHY